MKVTFLSEIELPISKQEPFDRHPGEVYLYFCPIVKCNNIWLITEAIDNIEAELSFRTNLAIKFVPSPYEVISSNWWMMTDLLNIHGAAVYPNLQSFPQDGVKRLINTNTESTDRQSKQKCMLDFLEWVEADSFFQQNRSKGKVPCNRLKMAPTHNQTFYSVLNTVTGRDTFRRPLFWSRFFPIIMTICLNTFFCSSIGLLSLQIRPPSFSRFHSSHKKCWVSNCWLRDDGYGVC